jgi:hypothetical protein
MSLDRKSWKIKIEKNQNLLQEVCGIHQLNHFPVVRHHQPHQQVPLKSLKSVKMKEKRRQKLLMPFLIYLLIKLGEI